MRNFSSAVAISIALLSLEIRRLRLTTSALSRPMEGKLSSLEELFDPLSNHRAYRLAIAEQSSAGEQVCAIPWLGKNVRTLDGNLN